MAQLTINDNIYIGNGGVMHVEVEDVVFRQGKVDTDRGLDYGKLSFGSETTWRGADNSTHVDGFVSSYASTFDFPVGNEDVFQSLRVFDYSGTLPLDAAFSYSSYQNTTDIDASLSAVSSRFYWKVNGGSQNAVLTLSWNTFSDVDQLLEDDLDKMSIAGFDGTQWVWIDARVDAVDVFEGSPSTILSGSITSKNPVNLSTYEAFTLANTTEEIVEEELVLVSQGFTPNGDGINDTWFIGKIEDFPNAVIKVFNKNSQEVFQSEGMYDNDNGWRGNYNSNSDPLPDGSYFYIIDLENDGTFDYSGWVYISR